MKEEYIPRSAVLSKTHDIHVKSKAGDVDYCHRCIDPSDVEAIPAADVRPVVLCKDCKNNYHCTIQDFMEDYGITPDDQTNFFCGYGEREES